MRILSYNIQAAIAADSYLSYLTRLHRQVLPGAAKERTLSRIAAYISAFDVVCLQEIDLGGLRNGFKSQVRQLLDATPFSHYVAQTNRSVGKLSLHGNLILSKLPLREVCNAPLPSRIPGRGMLAAAIGRGDDEIVVANVHLSLGRLDQYRQLRHIRQALSPYRRVCLLGDFNCPPQARQLSVLTAHGYRHIKGCLPTYPSWRPTQALDHIFLKGSLNGHGLPQLFVASDHLPVAVLVETAAGSDS